MSRQAPQRMQARIPWYLPPRMRERPLSTSTTCSSSGPSASPRRRGPEELHVVLVDNGRSRILGGKYHGILACIRCGACLDICPVFRKIGGHAYDAVYGGPIGAVHSPLLDGP